MSLDVRAIQVGDAVRWDGDSWTVEAFNGLALHLRSRGSRGYVVAALNEVVTSPGFAVDRSALPERQYGQRAPHPLDEFPEDVAAAARDLQRDLDRLLSGTTSRSVTPGSEVDDSVPPGGADQIGPHIGEYDGLTTKAKYALLGERRGVTARQVERWVSRYREFGAAGLVDERLLALNKGVKRIHPVLRSAMITVIEETKYASRVTNQELRKRVARRLGGLVDEEGNPVPVPIQRTFDRYLESLRGYSGRPLTQASLRNADNRPTGLVPWLSITRPMESVMLDTTPLDMFAMNPMAGSGDQQWQRVYLTIAVDVFSRSIVGWVFTSGEPRAEDVALLLYRIASPKIAQPHWPDRAKWRYPGAPDNLVFEATHDVEIPVDVAGSPFGRVETFVVDHGKVYVSESVRDACRILGSNLHLARVRTPTDKPQVEAAFRRIREQFVMPLPGYKGPDIASRGTAEEVEGKAFLFLWEIENYFAEWVACDYQNAVHEGLSFQSCPDLDLSPNEAYDYGVTRSGLLPVPPAPDLLLELLPTAWRTIQHYGVEIAGVRYDDTTGVLDDYRNLKSPWTDKKGRWKFKYDRADRSRIWFWAVDLRFNDPAIGSWLLLSYRGWREAPLFADEEVAYAKAVIIGRGGDVRDTALVEDTLDRILSRIHSDQELPAGERRMVGRTYLRSLVQAQRSAPDRVRERQPKGRSRKAPEVDQTQPDAVRGEALLAAAAGQDERRPDPVPADVTAAVPANAVTGDGGLLGRDPVLRAADDLDGVPLFGGPEEVEIDWFGSDGDTDDDSRGVDGTENLDREPEDGR